MLKKYLFKHKTLEKSVSKKLKHNIKLNAEGGRFVHNNIDEFNQDYTWGEVDTILDY